MTGVQYDEIKDGENDTYDETVGAANSGAAALGAGADTDDADRAAGQANQAIDIAGIDAEEAQEGRGSSGGGLGINRVSIERARGVRRRARTFSVLAQQAVVAWRATSLAGVAAARRGRAKVVRARMRENIVL